MNTISLDLASKVTGYCIFENDIPVTYGTIVAKEKDLEDRLIFMKYEIIRLFEKHKVEMVVSEQEQQHLNSAVTISLSKMQGMLRCLSDDFKISYMFVPINKWRIDVGIKHNQKREILKTEAISKVKELYNITTDSDDIAEAILIGRWFIKNKEFVEGWKNED